MIQFTREGYVSKLVNKGSSTASSIAKWYSAGFECWEVPGSIPSQGPRHTKDVIKMVPVVPLFSTQHSKGKILAHSQELR